VANGLHEPINPKNPNDVEKKEDGRSKPERQTD
jgi:hypothetical protein